MKVVFVSYSAFLLINGRLMSRSKAEMLGISILSGVALIEIGD
ncbi:MAG: hypothetical protein ACXWRZ_19180 [Bdellovibrio sp.]